MSNAYDEEYRRIHKARIGAEYDLVLSKIKDGKMFGQAIDMTDNKELVVAAYLCGKVEEIRYRMEPVKL